MMTLHGAPSGGDVSPLETRTQKHGRHFGSVVLIGSVQFDLKLLQTREHDGKFGMTKYIRVVQCSIPYKLSISLYQWQYSIIL